ncbi:glycosyltransferase family 2 protein [Paraburkholderia fungorum]|uniref:glycosyltransferase family 2 protein n=1 Tax=Paraburkholderia fungorum TaxID=134537 RepID=UPI000DB4D7F2|nr:glycosyltransferase family 2 protein [Paraburkholderia fungorum]PZR49122.1 MAG: glycosyl transferase family 2 [Paraburkholderia fungorum]
MDEQNPTPEVTELLQKLREAQHRIEALEAQNRDAVADRKSSAALRADIIELRSEIESLRASTSWRITAPVRQLSSTARAVRLTLATLRLQASQRNGFRHAFSYGLDVMKREGWAGIKQRLNRLVSGVGFADGPPSSETYQAWIAQHDSLTPARIAEIDARMKVMQRKPVFSIVVPTYDSDEHFLREMVKSVRDQLYPHWELCIADDASTQPRVKEVLNELAAQDPRIKVCFRAQNGHISEASNSALELATGDFIALLDHDDVLPAHALFMVAQYVNWHPEARMFYSDEDKLTRDGVRTTPYFKSDWNPQLFLAQNMFSHLGVYDARLIRQAGGFRKGMEGSQDYDLALRCVEIAGHDKVVHIPHILYHWRIIPGSTAISGSEKPYALLAGIKALEEHFARIGVSARVEQPLKELGIGITRIRYTVPPSPPKVSILIPTRDGLKLLEQCINSVFEKTIYSNYEIILIDNGSTEPETIAYFEKLKQDARVRVIRDESPFNFSALNNRAAAIATGELLCLMNNDIQVISHDWLDEMVSLAVQPQNGAIGACLWYPNDVLQHGGVIVGLGGVAGHMHHMMRRGHFGYFARGVAMQNLSAVTAACLVIRKSVYDEVGGFDETLAVAFNDVDFCLRVREAGYRNVWTPYAELYHHESASRGNDMDADKFARFATEVRKMEHRWGPVLETDPAYNPNLSLSIKARPFTLAEPPRKGMLD